MNKHILMLCEYFMPFDRGGSEWSIYYLSKQLVRDGFSVTVLTPNYGADAKELHEDITIERFPFYKKLKHTSDLVTPIMHSNIIWFLFTFIAILYSCLKKRPQAIHIQGKYFIPAAALVGSILRINTIVTLRDYIPLCPHNLCLRKREKACTLISFYSQELIYKLAQPSSLYRKLFIIISGYYGKIIGMILLFSLKFVDSVICISKKQRLLYENSGIRIHESIYNTCSFHTNAPKLVSPRHFLYVGRLTEGKGVPVLLKAYTQLRKRRNQPKLLLIGNGKLSIAYRSEGIEHIPYMKHSLIKKYMRKSYAVIVPSIWEEPFGRVALESLCEGVPVIGSDRGALPEIIGSKYGIVVKPDEKALCDALSKMLIKRKTYAQNIHLDYLALQEKFEKTPIQQYIQLYMHT